MTPHELAMRCKDSLERGTGRIVLTVPGHARGMRVRMDRGNRGRCPLGVVIGWESGPARTIAMFDPLDVLAWLHAKGLVEVDVKVREHDNG